MVFDNDKRDTVILVCVLLRHVFVTYMMDSFDVTTTGNVSVTTADVSGFSEVKYTGSAEYLFVVEVLWSDGRSMCVKRTYKDFLNFRKIMVDYFQSEITNTKDKGSVFIPTLTGLKMFRRYDRELAEERECELQCFVKNLLNGNPFVSSAPPVLEFFEPKPTDPVPYRSCPDGNDSDDEDPFSEEVFSRKWVKQEKSEQTT